MDDLVKQPQQNPNTFFEDVIEGLSQSPKTLPCKYFYDAKGSQLFEAICELEEYYITRTELALIESIKDELSERIGKNATIVEPGAGAGEKIQKLLSVLDAPNAYIPIDISEDFLKYSKDKININFPALEVQPIQADFTQNTHWQDSDTHHNKIVFFPGSTIGNFSPEEASELLENFADIIDYNGAIIVGFDLKKSANKIKAAYNDKKGVTAEFNKNILTRINRELNAKIDLNSFQHEAIFNTEESRIEMHLKSTREQTVNIKSQAFNFAKDETIHTENSYKYSNKAFINLAKKAGLKSDAFWTDNNNLISVHYLTLAN